MSKKILSRPNPDTTEKRAGKRAKTSDTQLAQSPQSTSYSTDLRLPLIDQEFFTEEQWEKVINLEEQFIKSYFGQAKKFSQLHGNISRWLLEEHKLNVDNELAECQGFTGKESSLLHTLAKFCVFML